MSTRREFVAMLLGGGIAGTLGCRSDERTIDGAFVDTGQQRGHSRIRDAGPQPATVTNWRRHRVAIVGAGVAGVAAAWDLRRRGIQDVVVFELDDVIGGTARGADSTVTPYPWGAHYIVSPAREQVGLIELLRELEAIEQEVGPDGNPIVDEALRCREPEERVFYRGRWYEGLYLHAGETAEDARQLKKFGAEVAAWTKWRDASGRPAFGIPVSRCSDDAEPAALDKITFGAWLDARGLVSERLRWWCDYACRDDFGLVAADTSAWAGLFYFAARAKGATDSQPVLTWPDGNFSLVRHLAKNARIERGVVVTRVDPDGSLIASGPDGVFGVHADRVIVAAPAFVANRMVGRTTQAPDYGAWAVANLHLRDRPREKRGEPPAWDNVFYDSESLGYVCATHQRGRDHGPTVWTWYYPFTGDAREARTKIAGAGHAEWTSVVLADIERAHPEIRSFVDRIDIAFWGHGMVRPRAGTMFAAERVARARPIQNVHFAHTDLSGIALFEEAFDHGLRASREVAEALA